MNKNMLLVTGFQADAANYKLFVYVFGALLE